MTDVDGSGAWDYAARIAEVKARIDVASAVSGRAGAGVQLLVATKTRDSDAVTAACAAGVKLAGENRMQELAAKGAAFRAGGARVHVIGPLQRNKAAIAVEWADCVQTVDSHALAERLSRLCVEAGRELDVMVQVNVSGEDTKAGVDPDDAIPLAADVQRLPALTVVGFMTVGLNSPNEEAVREGYARMREIRDSALVRSETGELPLREAWHLSMGMSKDLEWAIAEGATIVRVGSAIMGERSAPAAP